MTLIDLYHSDGKYSTSDKENPNHKYISRCYTAIFNEFKDREINLLEIGVAAGGSLLLWNDFFQKGTIYGIDNGNDERISTCVENIKPYNRICLLKADGYSREAYELLINFDIIIDDGPHTLETQLKCLELYLPKLKSGGLLIIEDIDSISYMEQFISKLSDEFTYSIIDTATELEYNSLLFVVRRK